MNNRGTCHCLYSAGQSEYALSECALDADAEGRCKCRTQHDAKAEAEQDER